MTNAFVFLSDMRRPLFLFVLWSFLLSSGGAQAADGMNGVADQYTHLVLALGQHDPTTSMRFTDQLSGKTQAEKEKKSLDAIGAEAAELMRFGENSRRVTSGDELLKLGREYLQNSFRAGGAVADVEGRKIKVQRRVARALRRAAPTFPDSHFDEIIAQLEAKIPGETVRLWKRDEDWRIPFVIPKEKLNTVFNSQSRNAAPRCGCTSRSRLTRVFTVEYATDKPGAVTIGRKAISTA